MTNDIQTGMLFIENGAFTPDMVEFGSEPSPAGWRAIMKPTVAELGKDLERTGWTFFYVAGGVHATGLGFNRQSRTRRALAKLIKRSEQENCNCLEITEIHQKSFLGIPVTSLAGRCRHIQKSRSFEKVWATSIAL